MTKREKRERKEKDRGIVDFMMVTNHFFHSFREWISEMSDPRNQSYITYAQTDLIYMGILKNVCAQHNMREMEENFNKTNCIDTRRIMSGNQKLLHESYEWLKNGGGTEQIQGLCKEKGTGCYANHVEEVAGKEEVMNVFEYEYEGRNKEGKNQTKRFCWITDIKLAKRNLEEMILAGRGRWKIENEGFNNQKNGIYRIEHLNSRNSNAMKNHYLLTQIADILMQLYLAWNLR